MSETPDTGALGNATPEQLPPPEGNVGEVLSRRPEAPELRAEEVRAAYEGWLERRGIDPTSVPRLEMGEREFTLFANASPSLARELYEIPLDDQDPCRYALVDIKPSDPTLPPEPELVSVTEADFGTALGFETIAKDFQEPDSDPDGSPTPESGPAYVIVDIGEALATSYGNLQEFATTLMKGKTANPFSSDYGDIAVRAGGLAPGQKDAYVWTAAPIARSVELTLNNPLTYASVCVVRGQMREAGNGKPGMAQIDNPEVVLEIEGEDLANLQETYQALYQAPDFALTRVQREERDALFNDHVIGLISEAARSNKAREDDEARRYEEEHQPRYRYHQHP